MPTSAALRRVDYVPISDLVAADRNPKEHDVAGIGRSISRWGFADAPIMDERTGRLVAGHGRLADLLARQRAQETPPDGIVVESGAWLVPVQRGWASRSDEEADAFLVAHNRLTERGGWDNRMLADLLGDFAESDLDLLVASGYDQDDLNAMLTELADRPEEKQAPEEFPSYDEDTIETQHQCPRCAYQWSGKSS